MLQEGNWVKVRLSKKLLDTKAVLGPAAPCLGVSASFDVPVAHLYDFFGKMSV